jgi:hypothetical protein
MARPIWIAAGLGVLVVVIAGLFIAGLRIVPGGRAQLRRRSRDRSRRSV